MAENFETNFGFLNVISNKVLHHAILLPQIYAVKNCKLLLEYIAWNQGESVERVLSSPDNLFFTKFSTNEVPLKIGDQDKWDSGARLIIKFAQGTGFSEKKVIVVEEIENASRQALNALLKIIEEPPKNTTFYLIYGDLRNVIDTVRSRCYTVREQINTKEKFETLANFLEAENNFEKFQNSGYEFTSYLKVKSLNTREILQKLLEYSVDENFIFDAISSLEQELLEKFLKAKDVFEIEKLDKAKERFDKLKKACDNLNTNKYTMLVELTEEIHAINF